MNILQKPPQSESLEQQFDHSARISTHMFTEMKQEENDFEPEAYPGKLKIYQ
jgi:hypothetical protein